MSTRGFAERDTASALLRRCYRGLLRDAVRTTRVGTDLRHWSI